MGISDRWRKQIEGGDYIVTRKFVSGAALAIALLVAGTGVSRAQETPAHQADPQVSPIPRSSPLESPQAFVQDDAAYLGITLGDVTPEIAGDLKLPVIEGAIVIRVLQDSPAAKAKLESGDVIVGFDGERVRSSAELRRLIRETPPGRTVAIKITRAGKALILSADLKPSPHIWYGGRTNDHMSQIRPPAGDFSIIHPPPMNFGEIPATPMIHRGMLGISGQDLTPQLAQYFGVKQGKGLLVAEVTKGGPGDRAGLKAGDVIVQVDGQSIGGLDELRAALNEKFTGDTRKVSLTFVRDRHEQTVSADLTRFQMRDESTSNQAGSGDDVDPASVRARANDLRALAQRARVQAEVMKQQKQVDAEWQRQLLEQMSSLKNQLKQLQNIQVAVRQDGEI